MNREDDRVALVWGKHFDSRLFARPLFGEDKFTALEIPFPLAQEESDLKGKDYLAIQILMQTVEITGPVLKHQRRRPLLACPVASFDEL
jgi:hypothetical protein